MVCWCACTVFRKILLVSALGSCLPKSFACCVCECATSVCLGVWVSVSALKWMHNVGLMRVCLSLCAGKCISIIQVMYVFLLMLFQELQLIETNYFVCPSDWLSLCLTDCLSVCLAVCCLSLRHRASWFTFGCLLFGFVSRICFTNLSMLLHLVTPQIVVVFVVVLLNSRLLLEFLTAAIFTLGIFTYLQKQKEEKERERKKHYFTGNYKDLIHSRFSGSTAAENVDYIMLHFVWNSRKFFKTLLTTRRRWYCCSKLCHNLLMESKEKTLGNS